MDRSERLIVRPAVAADVRGYYGAAVRPTLRAMVMELDGQVVGMVGLARWVTFYEFFSEVKPEARELLRDRRVLRGILKAASWIPECRLPVVAVELSDEPDSARLLERFGFERVEGAVHKWRC